MSKKKHKIFVYGTLREGEAATHGLYHYKLWSLGQFPCITPCYDELYADEPVKGNIVEVNDVMLEKLDRYENLKSGLYTREKVVVVPLGDGTEGCTEDVWAYVAGNCFPQPIESGDWLDFINQQ